MNNILQNYIVRFFLKIFSRIFGIFILFVLLVTILDEIGTLKSLKEQTLINYIFIVFFKAPTLFLNFVPFIFLFSGIFFFLELFKNNEIIALRNSSFSNFRIILIPSIVSFLLGIIIIFLLVPFSSFFLKKYENMKSQYNDTSNLLTINQTGFWIYEKRDKNKIFLHLDNLNFKKKTYDSGLLFIFDNNMEFIEKIDLKEGKIFDNKIEFNELVNNNKDRNLLIYKNKITKMDLPTEIILNKFRNVETVNFFDIRKEIELNQSIGYSTDFLTTRYHKIVSLPFYIFLMIIFSGLIIINLKKTASYLVYGIIGVFVSVILYFLNDLSIAAGLTGSIPLVLSIWLPILLISIFNVVGMIQTNAK